MQIRLTIMCDKELYEELHRLMGYAIKDSQGVTAYRICKSKKLQDWYRQVIQEGIESLLKKFEKEKRELEAGDVEIPDSH